MIRFRGTNFMVQSTNANALRFTSFRQFGLQRHQEGEYRECSTRISSDSKDYLPSRSAHNSFLFFLLFD